MYSVMLFTFNTVEIYVMTINKNIWTRAREVCKALEYGKANKFADIIKQLCSRENYAHKWHLTEFASKMKFMDWPWDSRKDDYYTNDERVYKLLFSS